MVVMELKMYYVKLYMQLGLFRCFAATKMTMKWEMSKKGSI